MNVSTIATEDIVRMWTRHKAIDGLCASCAQPAPCDARRLSVELGKERAIAQKLKI